MSTAELASIGEALRLLEADGVPLESLKGRVATISQHAAGAIRLLMFTGCRVSVLLKLRWEDLDMERGIAKLPDAKRGPRAMYLSAPGLEVVFSLPRSPGHDWVIEAQQTGHRMTTLRRPWERVCAVAKLSGVRLHDLRHSLEAITASGGDSLLIVGALLGHRRAASTERYAHLSADPVRAAAERVGAAIESPLEGRSAAVRAMGGQRRAP